MCPMGRARQWPLPGLRQAPSRSGQDPVRAMRVQGAGGGSGTPPSADRGAGRPGPLPEMRQVGTRPRARALPVLQREAEPGRPGERRQASRRGCATAGSSARQGVRTRAKPSALCRAGRRRHLHKMRKRSGASGPDDLRILRGEAPGARPEASRQGQGRGPSLRRPGSGGAPQGWPEAWPSANEGPSRRRPLHSLRTRSAGGGPVDVRALPRGQAGGQEGPASTAARGRPLHKVRNARPRRQGVLRILRCREEQVSASRQGGQAGLGPPALRESEGPRRMHEMREAGKRGRRVPVLPRCRPGTLPFPPRCRAMRGVLRANLRRRGHVRPVLRRQGGAPQPRGGVRGAAPTVCRPAGPPSLCRLLGALGGSGALRGLRSPARRRLGRVSRHPGLGSDMDGRRAGHRPRARAVRQRGRRRALPGLREAIARRGGGSGRRLANGAPDGPSLGVGGCGRAALPSRRRRRCRPCGGAGQRRSGRAPATVGRRPVDVSVPGFVRGTGADACAPLPPLQRDHGRGRRRQTAIRSPDLSSALPGAASRAPGRRCRRGRISR